MSPPTDAPVKVLKTIKVLEHTDRTFRGVYPVSDPTRPLDSLITEARERLRVFLANRGQAMTHPATFAIHHGEPLALAARVAVGPRPTRKEKYAARAAAGLVTGAAAPNPNRANEVEDVLWLFQTGSAAWEVAARTGLTLQAVADRAAGHPEYVRAAECEYRLGKAS